MISSECSSHFKAAYNDYQSAEKQKRTEQENKRNSFNHHNDHYRYQRHNHNKNEDKLNKVIRRFSQIPTIINQEDEVSANKDDKENEKDNIDIFDYYEGSRNGHGKNQISPNDVPVLWKKDRRHSAGFLSPLHLNELNKKHLRKTSNPEGFEGLRELSSRLQVERTSEASKIGFDSDYGGSDDDNDEENKEDADNVFLSTDTDRDVDTTKLSPQSNNLLERRRRLSTDYTSSNDKLITTLTVHNSPLKVNRRLSVDNFLSLNKIPAIPKMKRLSKKPSCPTLPKIKSEFLINQTAKETGKTKTRLEAERRSSNLMLSPKLQHRGTDTSEYFTQTGKRKTSLIMERKPRRASRII